MSIDNEQKKRALDAALLQIEKQYGKGAVMKLGDPSVQMNIETIPTGSLSLDIALGLGGIPKGRIIEIYGPESSGKTTVTLHMIAEVQKRGGIAGFIDAEHALDPVYAKNIGVDIDNLYISQPDSGEQALEIAETMVRSGAIDIVVIDSVAALVPKAEIDGDMGDSHVGLHARLMSQALRKLTAVISKSIFIRENGCQKDRIPQAERRSDRQQDQDPCRQEQDCTAFQGGGVRYHVRQGHFLCGRCAGPRGEVRHHQ